MNKVIFVLAAMLASYPAFSAELTLVGWTKTNESETPEQRIIGYNKKYVSNNRMLTTGVTQVRNGTDWHWQQSFYIDIEGKNKQLCWNVVRHETKLPIRWYIAPDSPFLIIMGVAEDTKNGLDIGQNYLEIRTKGDNEIRFVFKCENNGVYVFAGNEDNPNF